MFWAVTNLCHPPACASPFPVLAATSERKIPPTNDPAVTTTQPGNYEGHEPSAHDDNVATNEETTVIIEVLANDESGEGEDDEDDENEIDESSVDLDPDSPGINQSLTLAQGSLTVNAEGVVTYAPALDYVGEFSVRYTVSNNDGDTSDPATIFITVLNINDPPSITGQAPDPIAAMENTSFEIALTNLIVNDVDNAYPNGFTIGISPGDNYSFAGTIITPVGGFSGPLTVSLSVNDGDLSSAVFQVNVSVAATNDAPVITGQTPNPLTTSEDTPVAIAFSNLLVTDADNTYPEGFTMTLSPGDDYTVSGSTVTPNPDFTGTLSVPVVVNDGALDSNTFPVVINVNGGNDAPVITGQSPVSVDEDNSVAIIFANLQVTDSDNTYPTGFTMSVSPGENYTVSENTVTPSENFYGTLTVPVVVNDGTSNSAPFNLAVTVNPVNDIPIITGQAELSISEGESLTLGPSHLMVTDPDNIYPDDFSLSILAGSNYTVAGTVITPGEGFNGLLTVPVFVTDGIANSAMFNVQITVNAVNDPPVIIGQQPLSVEEEQPLTIRLTDLIVTDSDNTYPDGFTLLVLAGTNYSVNSNSVTPATDFTGTLSVAVLVNDGVSDSQPFNVQVTVTAVNDAPVITGQNALVTPEDVPLVIGLEHFIVSDPDNAFPTGFLLTVFAGTNYTIEDNTITPLPDFHGALLVQVQVSDGILSSNIFEATVSVTSFNDPPVIIGQLPLSTEEDVPVTISLSHLLVTDADNTYPQGFTVRVQAGEGYSISGTTVIPATDFTGTLNISLVVNDGVSDSAPFIFQVQVGDANDPPTITGQAELQTGEEQSFAVLLSHLTVYDPDNAFPSGFSLLVSPGENFAVSGNVITPNLNFAGLLSVPVRVNDGINNSAVFNLQVHVNQINDAPGFDGIANQSISENSPKVNLTITNISKGPGENDQQLTLIARSGNTAIIPDPTINYNGTGATATLGYTPVAHASGIVTITVTAIDSGPATAPHVNSYSSSFQIEVEEINAAPTLTDLINISIQEDASQQNIALSGISAGPGESQQISVTASADKPELLEVLSIVYTSPQKQGTLLIKPAANAFGNVRIEVAVTDNGSGASPNINRASRTFTLTIVSVNDTPVVTSTPPELAAVGEPYVYDVKYTDVEKPSLPVALVTKPAWLNVSSGQGVAQVKGTPTGPGNADVRLRITDGEIIVDQSFTIMVNTRPVGQASSLTITEDETTTFQPSFFNAQYSDADGHPIIALQITQTPGAGSLILNDNALESGDTVLLEEISALSYQPNVDYAGTDAFYWKPYDGYHFSAEASAVDIVISPVNDAPDIVLGTDTLRYEVNGEPSVLALVLDIEDPDSDSLSFAELSIDAENFQPEADRLIFTAAQPITGTFDYQNGILRLSGKAPLKIMKERSVPYNIII